MIRNQFKLQKTAVILFFAAMVLFFLFFSYIIYFEDVHVFHARESTSYTKLEDYVLEHTTDDTAPVGIRHVYRWIVPDGDVNESCLCILSVHQTVEVWMEDELLYSLYPDSTNRIGGSPGTNWSTIPLHISDSGREITIVVTPLFESVTDYGAEFWCGSRFAILFDQLLQELPQLFTATLCMLIGIFIILVQFYLHWATKSQTLDLLFLGCFSALLGLWRLTYASSITMLNPQNPMAIGYITIGSLFLCCLSLGLYASTLVKQRTFLLLHSCICSCITILILCLQVFNILELKEMLTVCHVLLVATILIMFIAMWRQRKTDTLHQRHRHPFILLGIGIFLDLISYNLNEVSSDAVFTIFAMILYCIIILVSRVMEISRKAYTDTRTGLANQFRWNDLMQETAPISAPIGILMMDLNGLKHVNDTLGHAAGDRIIFDFSNILRNTLPASSVICRWGGDEFAVMLTGITREQLDLYIHNLHLATEAYNQAHPELPIHFALGSSLSSAHPTLTRVELFHLADEEMYRNKQKWYERHHIHMV